MLLNAGFHEVRRTGLIERRTSYSDVVDYITTSRASFFLNSFSETIFLAALTADNASLVFRENALTPRLCESRPAKSSSRIHPQPRDIEEMAHASISVIAGTLIALFSMTAIAETPPPAASGIEGAVFVSPNRPGPISKDGPSRGPAGNVQFLVKSADVTVKTFTTDGEGRFQVALPPGHYVILREDAGAGIGHWRFEADVVAGEMTKVNWTADSGMR